MIILWSQLVRQKLDSIILVYTFSLSLSNACSINVVIIFLSLILPWWASGEKNKNPWWNWISLCWKPKLAKEMEPLYANDLLWHCYNQIIKQLKLCWDTTGNQSHFFLLLIMIKPHDFTRTDRKFSSSQKPEAATFGVSVSHRWWWWWWWVDLCWTSLAKGSLNSHDPLIDSSSGIGESGVGFGKLKLPSKKVIPSLVVTTTSAANFSLNQSTYPILFYSILFCRQW